MELSPHAIASASFRVVKKGFDPDEVRSYLGQVATTVEQAQNQSTAMEARARAAVAKLQELSQQPAAEPEVRAAPDEVETISRTLLLAQRTADTAIAEAKAEADELLAAARAEAATALEEARASAAKAIDDARWEARRSAEGERVKAEGEVQALLARREFLVSDVEHLEAFVQAQRERLQEAALAISDLVDRVPAGLGEMRRPLLSAAGDVPLPLDGGVVESEPTPVMQSVPPAPERDRERDATLPLDGLARGRVDEPNAATADGSAAGADAASDDTQ